MIAGGKDSHRVWGLVCGLPSAIRAGRTLVILRGHFDDSGSNANEPLYVLAGLLAPVEAWGEFSDAWRAALDAPRPNGGKGLEYFKGNEAHRLKRQFDGWSEADRDARVLALAKVAGRYATHRFCVHISRSQFELAMARYRADLGRRVADGAAAERDFPLSLDPYFLLFYSLVVSVATERRLTGLGEDCEYIFDCQGALGDRTAGYWDMMTANASAELAPWLGQKPQHWDDKIILPLQAADLYAWHWRRMALEPDGQMPSAALLELRHLKAVERPVSQERLNKIVGEIIEAWQEASASGAQGG